MQLICHNYKAYEHVNQDLKVVVVVVITDLVISPVAARLTSLHAAGYREVFLLSPLVTRIVTSLTVLIKSDTNMHLSVMPKRISIKAPSYTHYVTSENLIKPCKVTSECHLIMPRGCKQSK